MLTFEAPAGATPAQASVTVDGNAIPATLDAEPDRLSVRLEDDLILREGQTLRIVLRRET